MFHAVSRISADADWTEEELKEAIRAEGGDPDQFVNHMLPKITELLAAQREQQAHDERILGQIFGPKDSRSEDPEQFNRQQAIEMIQQSLKEMHDDQLRAILEIIRSTERARP